MRKVCCVTVTLFLLQSAVRSATVVANVDSYLSALAASKSGDQTSNSNNDTRREDLTSYPEYPPTQNTESKSTYLPPSSNYGTPVFAPSETYSLPQQTYGGPYHKPESTYLPSKPDNSYLPPPRPSFSGNMYLPPSKPYPPAMPPPYPMEMSKGAAFHKWLWDNLKLKIDLHTIGKLLIKLLIFKKIVKFIAVLCLLLVVPTLKSKIAAMSFDGDSMEDDLMRGFHSKGRESEINDMTSTITRAIETFAHSQLRCHEEPSASCKLLDALLLLTRDAGQEDDDEGEANEL